MEDQPTGSRGEDSRLVKDFLGLYDVPAYVRRARRVQDAYENLIDRCRRQRQDWLQMVRVRLGLLRALAGDWERLRPLLGADAPMEVLQGLEVELAPRLRQRMTPAKSQRTLRRCLLELTGSIDRFNARWIRFTTSVDLSAVNALRDDYNRHYLVEKECAMRSARLARLGFQPLPHLTIADLLARLPPLQVPRAK
jgi:hypothetical protein